MNNEDLNKLLIKEIIKPTLLIGGIPTAICFIVGVIIGSFYSLKIGTYFLVFSSVYFVFVIVIGIGAGGLDFRNKYGYPEELVE